MFDEELITWSIDGGGRPFYRRKHKYSVTNVSGFLRIKRRDKWNYRYLHAYLSRLQSRIQFDYQMKAHPSVIRELYELRWIPLPEQKKIARILDTLDTQIRQTEALIAKLERIKQGLLTDLLTRGIDQNGQLRPAPDQAPGLYKDSRFGRIPQEWEVKQLSDLAEVNRGKFTHRPRNDPEYYGGEYPFIQTSDVAAAKGGYVYDYSQTLSRLGTTASSVFPAGTIAITIAANIADTAILGIPMYFPDSVVGAVVNRAIADMRFIELCIRRAKRALDAKAPQSAQKNINLQDLRPLLIPTPSLAEQKSTSDRYETLMSKIATERKLLGKLCLEKTALMDDLLTGRVRVTPLLESKERATA